MGIYSKHVNSGRCLLRLLLICLALVLYVPRLNAEVCSEEGWCYFHPTPHDGNIAQIWGSSSTNFWGGGTALLHYNEGAWSKSSLEQYDPTSIYPIAGSAANNVFAVAGSAELWRSNGTEWSVCQGVNRPAGVAISSLSVLSPSEVYLGLSNGVVLRYDGTSSTQVGESLGSNVSTLAAIDSNNIYASNETQFLHFNGSAWTALEATSLRRLWIGDDDRIFAVMGDNVFESNGLYTYTGGTWQFLGGVKTAHGTSLAHIYALRPNQQNSVIKEIYRYTGDVDNWQLVYSAHWLEDIQVFPDGTVVAAGSRGTVARFNGSEWQLIGNPNPTAPGMDKLWGAPDGHLFSVSGPHLMHYDGSAWSTHTIPPEDSDPLYVPNVPRNTGIYGVWGTASNNVFAVGAIPGIHGGIAARIFHFNGNGWQEQAVSASERLRAVSGNASVVYAVGDTGTIQRFNGTTWEAQSSGVTENLMDVWVSTDGKVFAVGNSGRIVQFDGSAWQAVQVSDYWGQNPHFAAVWGSSADNVIAVGWDSIWRFDGTSWSLMENRPYLDAWDLLDIFGSGPNDIWTVGQRGLTLHYDGTGWTAIKGLLDVGMTLDLTGVWVSASGRAYAADGSALYRFNRELLTPTPTPTIVPTATFTATPTVPVATPTPTATPTPIPGVTAITVSGKVSNSTGTGASGVSVFLYSGEQAVDSAVTKSDGSYSLKAPAYTSLRAHFTKADAVFSPAEISFYAGGQSMQLADVVMALDLARYSSCSSRSNVAALASFRDTAEALSNTVQAMLRSMQKSRSSALVKRAAKLETNRATMLSQVLTTAADVPDVSWSCPAASGCTRLDRRSAVARSLRALRKLHGLGQQAALSFSTGLKRSSEAQKTKMHNLIERAQSAVSKVRATSYRCGS